ncbi:MAG: T9SS type A sorting domain-containing protein [candidate division Zixibacteria bacterium]|nr:T9SS type A sorting domain-containing protein [candidate division Zixibacteria bacterium]
MQLNRVSIALLSVLLLLTSQAIAGTVAGIVQDQDGNAIGGAFVGAFDPRHPHLVDSTFTNDAGEYNFDLDEGMYKFMAVGEQYREQWYDHKPSFERADMVHVPGNGVVDDINFALEGNMPPQFGGISGNVQGFTPPDTSAFPIAGATIAVFIPEHNRPFRVTESGNNGDYLFEELPVGRYIVMARAEGFYPQWYPMSPNPEGAQPVEVIEGGITDGIDFLLEEGEIPEDGMISGFVYSRGDDNPPLPGAVVSLFVREGHEPIRRTEAGDDGYYVFDDLPPGVYFVEARHEGFHPQWFDMKPNRREADPIPLEQGSVIEDINFVLEGGGEAGRISGMVRAEETQRPLPGAHVLVFPVGSDDPIAETRAGEQGMYMFQRLPTGEYHVIAAAEGFEPQWFDHVPERRQATVVVLEPNSHVDDINFDLLGGGGQHTGFAGMVVTQDNHDPRPIPGARVEVFHPNEPRPFAFGITNDRGEYHIQTRPGRYIAVAKKQHFEMEWYEEKPVRERADIFVVEENQVTEHIDFTLAPHQAPEGAIFGTTYNAENNEPLHHVRVTARMIDPGHGHRRTFSQRNGSYELNHLPEGRYLLFAEHPGFYPVHYPDTIEVGEEPVGPIDFMLEEIVTGYMSGHVYSDNSNDPIWNARIMAVNTEHPQVHRVTHSHRDGYYIFDVLPEGFYMVKAEAHGFLPQVYPDSVGVFEDNPAEGIDFHLSEVELGSIAGFVLEDSSGAPIAEARVHAHRLGGHGNGRAETGDDGSYLIDELMPGYYRLTAAARGYHPAHYPDSVFLENGGTLEDINFFLVPMQGGDGHIGGMVTDSETGNPLPRGMVVAFGPLGENGRPVFRAMTYTNERGMYAFDNLPRNFEYRIAAGAPGYVCEFYDDVYTWEDATPVVCDADGIDFALDHHNTGFLSITGMITDREGPVPGAVLYANDEESNLYVTLADIEGYFAFEDLPPGDYSITATDFGVEGSYPGGVEVVFNDYYGADITLGTTDVDEGNENVIPTRTALVGNYPNPFNPQTSIEFELSTPANVEITIYNIRGQMVNKLVEGQFEAGTHDVTWDSVDENGNAVSAGIYFYRFTAGDIVSIGKMTLIK